MRTREAAIARAFVAMVLAALVSAACTSGPHRTQAQRASSAAPTVAAVAPACTAAQGSLVPSAAPFLNGNRLIQPFAYVNGGQPCYVHGFPTVQLYNAQRQLLTIAEVDGNVVLGTAVAARYLLPHDNATGGFNMETPTSGSCETASYVSASFGEGSTPLVAIDYQVCGTLYLTPIFE